MILVEITAVVDGELGTTERFFVSNGSYVSKPSDNPANAVFIGALANPGDLGLNVYGNGRTGGTGTLDVGALILRNNDGRFDPWAEYGFDGQQVIIKVYTPGLPYADMPRLFTGTVDGPPVLTTKQLTLRLRDKQIILDKEACTRLYLGDNVLPLGVEGTEADLKDTRVPRTFGIAFEVPAGKYCVNTSKLVYQVNDGPVFDIPAVFDRGELLTKATDHATSIDLLAATGTSGQYHTCLAEGLFRLFAQPNGSPTANVWEGATEADRTAGQIIKRLALSAGVDPTEFSYDDLSRLDLEQPAQVGIFVEGTQTFRQAIGEVAESISGYAVFQPSGLYRLGRLIPPAGEPVLNLTASQLLSIEKLTARDGDLPSWQTKVNYGKIYTVQTSDLAGDVSAERRQYLSREWRSAVSEWPTVKIKHALSKPYEIKSLMIGQADAKLESSRLLDMNRVRRDMFEILVHIDVLPNGMPDLMSCVRIQYQRFGLSAGKLFVLLGVRLELARGRARLTVWG